MAGHARMTPARKLLVDRALGLRRRRAKAELTAAHAALARCAQEVAAIEAEIAREQAAIRHADLSLLAGFAAWHDTACLRRDVARAAMSAAEAACEPPREQLLEVLRIEQGIAVLGEQAAREAQRRAAATSPLLELLARPATGF